MGNGHGVHLAHLGAREPGTQVGGHPGAHQAGLVAANGVVGQGGTIGVGVQDLTIGQETQLDEGLEAVANTQHQTVPLLQQRRDLFLNGGIAEKGGDEFGGAVRLIPAGEAAGEENHLRLLQLSGKFLHTLRNGGCR